MTIEMRLRPMIRYIPKWSIALEIGHAEYMEYIGS
jgi:hypothetical protein